MLVNRERNKNQGCVPHQPGTGTEPAIGCNYKGYSQGGTWTPPKAFCPGPWWWNYRIQRSILGIFMTYVNAASDDLYPKILHNKWYFVFHLACTMLNLAHPSCQAVLNFLLCHTMYTWCMPSSLFTNPWLYHAHLPMLMTASVKLSVHSGTFS